MWPVPEWGHLWGPQGPLIYRTIKNKVCLQPAHVEEVPPLKVGGRDGSVVGALAVLPDHLGLIPSNHVAAYNHL